MYVSLCLLATIVILGGYWSLLRNSNAKILITGNEIVKFSKK